MKDIIFLNEFNAIYNNFECTCSFSIADYNKGKTINAIAKIYAKANGINEKIECKIIEFISDEISMFVKKVVV